ncbi:MAG TPA: helix-turn-helix transcriptional regulator [Candidatus Acidoferrales bacterium]|nr:helix-turn-helix transcriptional regulator [Candidatus Acidoferrales bacterium]
MARPPEAASSRWTVRVREAYALARFSEASAIFDEHAPAAREIPVELVLTRARIALARDASTAVDLLLAQRGRFASDVERFASELLLGAAFAQLREYETADAHFDRARQQLDPRSLAQAAQLAAARGRRYIAESRIGDAWRCYETSLVDRRIDGRIVSEGLKAEIHRAESRYGEHAASLMRLLTMLGENLDAHVALWYRTIGELGILASELPAPAAAATVADAVASRPVWSPDFASDHFNALRSLAWCKALAGDSLGSFRYLRDAGSLAESLGSAALRAIVMLDRAQLARNAGEEHWCANELAAAIDLLHGVDWPRTSERQRAALLLLAEVLAPTDPASAAAAIARHSTLVESRDPIATAARGVVHVAGGRVREGVRDLSAAYESFSQAGCEWRAGKAALALAQATGRERWRLLALENLEFYDRSWLYAQAREIAEQAVASEDMSLTPTQERVFNMICEGLSTDAIAARLGRSRSTVRNHLKLIFKALGVRSRAALVAKAARTGRFT